MIKILVVDDSALVRKLLGQVFQEEADFEVEFARSGVEALGRIGEFKPDVVTLDVQMPEMDGLACLDRIMIERPCPVIMVSTLTAEGADATLQALRLGAIDFVPKPEGAVSLRMDQLAPELVRKVRAAAGAKIRASTRLRDRVRHHISSSEPAAVRRVAGRPGIERPMSGEGLVLVGSSTGGPPALEALLTPLPASFPWPILVAQHMPANFTASLARRLDGICALTVVEVAKPELLQPGCVYIGRGDADLIVTKRAGRLYAMSAPAQADYLWHPSANRLVSSAMSQLPPTQLIGVLLTGMGNDGAEAMTAVHAQGGRTIAEAEETAVVWGMPGELVKAGGADWVLPLPDIAGHLQTMVS